MAGDGDHVLPAFGSVVVPPFSFAGIGTETARPLAEGSRDERATLSTLCHTERNWMSTDVTGNCADWKIKGSGDRRWSLTLNTKLIDLLDLVR